MYLRESGAEHLQNSTLMNFLSSATHAASSLSAAVVDAYASATSPTAFVVQHRQTTTAFQESAFHPEPSAVGLTTLDHCLCGDDP
jgi:hypothetical protein